MSTSEKIDRGLPWVILAASTALFFMLLCGGCASFTTDQRDLSYDPKTGEKREITTRATARTFAASRSALAQWQASQTDKTQGARVGGLSQESQSAETLRALLELFREFRR